MIPQTFNDEQIMERLKSSEFIIQANEKLNLLEDEFFNAHKSNSPEETIILDEPVSTILFGLQN